MKHFQFTDISKLKVYRANIDGETDGIGRLFAAIYQRAVIDEINANLHGKSNRSVKRWVGSRCFAIYPRMLGMRFSNKFRKAFWITCENKFKKIVNRITEGKLYE